MILSCPCAMSSECHVKETGGLIPKLDDYVCQCLPRINSIQCLGTYSREERLIHIATTGRKCTSSFSIHFAKTER